MTPTPADHASYHRSLRLYQEAVEEQVLIPEFNRLIDVAWMHGALPLPELEWGLREVWYLGDLR